MLLSNLIGSIHLYIKGEVESIAQMKPKSPNEHEDGLLEYLEDIIGTSKYNIPIEKANKKVEQLDEQKLEKLHRVQIVEKQKLNLEVCIGYSDYHQYSQS